jgi:hypothetical protein
MSLNCKEVIIHNSEETDYISDHYPIEAVFEIENEKYLNNKIKLD